MGHVVSREPDVVMTCDDKSRILGLLHDEFQVTNHGKLELLECLDRRTGPHHQSCAKARFEWHHPLICTFR